MRSIRAQVLAWVLPGFVVVCAAAGLGVYYSVKQAIDADQDARLSRLAGSARLALRNQMSAESEKVRLPGLKAFLAKEEFQSSGQYFQLWSASRETQRRSPNLLDMNLPRPSELTRDAIRYDETLTNGDRVRVTAMRIPQGGREAPWDFAVAVSRTEGEARLSRLGTDLLMGAVGCSIVLCLLLVFALRFAMRPLARVGEQAAAMGAGSLHERFVAKSLPEEIAPIVARLNDLLGRLEQSFERERRFSGYLAHELRTPLAAIRTTSEVAAKWPAQSSPEDFHDIAQASARLQQTVDSLLLLARLETTSNDIAIEAVALRPLVDECLALHWTRAKERNLRFTKQLDQSLTLETDPRLLRIIVNNLLANATEYAPLGSGITISSAEGDPFFRVGNPAPNLNVEDIPRLFDRLWRKDVSRSDAAHAGLGLSIANSCAVAMGFTLTAELDEGGFVQISLHKEK